MTTAVWGAPRAEWAGRCKVARPGAVLAAMNLPPPRITYIGGPTALIEVGPLRLLTDPTFDPAGTAYPTPAYALVKSQPPAVPVRALGRIDAVLLSHDHHADNLDLRRADGPRRRRSGPDDRRRGGPAGRPGPGARPVGGDRDPDPRRDRPHHRHPGPARPRPGGPRAGHRVRDRPGPGRARRAVRVRGHGLVRGGGRGRPRSPSESRSCSWGRPRWPRPPVAADVHGRRGGRGGPGVRGGPTSSRSTTKARAHFTEHRSDVDRAFERAGLDDRLRWLRRARRGPFPGPDRGPPSIAPEFARPSVRLCSGRPPAIMTIPLSRSRPCPRLPMFVALACASAAVGQSSTIDFERFRAMSPAERLRAVESRPGVKAAFRQVVRGDLTAAVIERGPWTPPRPPT